MYKRRTENILNSKARILCVSMAVILVFSVIFSILPVFSYSEQDPFVVVIDPGHGGNDPGAVVTENGVSYEEKVFNLEIAKAIKEELSKYENTLVYLTRTDNDSSYISIAARIAYAKIKDADLFISVHNNSAAPSATGCCAMAAGGGYNKSKADASNKLETAVLKKLEALGCNNMGLQYRYYDEARGITYPNGANSDYYGVIRGCMLRDITCSLIEYEFMTNTNDLAKLRDPEMRKAYGKATAEAIAETYGLTKGENTLTQAETVPQTSSVKCIIEKRTYTYGDAPFTPSASGGTGEGEYFFNSDKLDAVDFEGTTAYIKGPGTATITASYICAEGYAPKSSYGSGSVEITVLPKNVSIDASASSADDFIRVKCTLKEYVSGDLPKGAVTITSGEKQLFAGSFSASDTFSADIPKTRIENNILKITYTPATYDNYSGASKEIIVGSYIENDRTPTPAPASTPTTAPTSTPTPAPTPTTAPTSTPTPAPTPTGTPEPIVTDTPSPTPYVTPDNTPTETDPETAAPSDTPDTDAATFEQKDPESNTPGPSDGSSEEENNNGADARRWIIPTLLGIIGAVIVIDVVLYFISKRKKLVK